MLVPATVYALALVAAPGRAFAPTGIAAVGRAAFTPLPHMAKFAPTARTSTIRLAEAAEATAPAVEEDAVVESEGPTPVQETLAGMTVAFSLLTKAIACSAMCKLSPLVGVWSSVVLGLTAPLLGGRAGVTYGVAAVIAVPLSTFVAAYGTAYVPLLIIMSALMQLAFSAFKLVPLAGLVSSTVMAGFLNGLGVVLAKSQIHVFAHAAAIVPTVAIAALSFAIILGLPMITTAVPSALVALIVTTLISVGLGLPLETLGSTSPAGTFAGGLATLPSFINIPDFMAMATSPAALKICFPAAVSVAFIAILEALLAARAVDNLKGESQAKDCTMETTKDNFDKDCGVSSKSVTAMGVGNTISGFLGGFGGCGLVPQTILNLKSGGGGPISSYAYAISMALFVMAFAPSVALISHAALAGVMFTIAYDTIEWKGSWNVLKDAVSKDFSDKATAVSRVVALAFASYTCRFDMVTGVVGGVVIERFLQPVLAKVLPSA